MVLLDLTGGSPARGRATPLFEVTSSSSLNFALMIPDTVPRSRRFDLIVSGPSAPAPSAVGFCVQKPGPTAAEALHSFAVRLPALC
jgi:hypothetical protein